MSNEEQRGYPDEQGDSYSVRKSWWQRTTGLLTRTFRRGDEQRRAGQ